MEIIEANSILFPKMEALIRKVWTPTYLHYIDYQQLLYMQKYLYGQSAFVEQQREGHRFYAAIENDRLLGFVSIVIEEGVLKIPKLYVDIECQRKGVGTALLQFVKKWAKNEGLNTIELNVNRYNKSVYFYRRNGFYIHSSVDIPLKEFFLNDYVLRMKL